MESTNVHKQKQDEFWIALIKKYEKRNLMLEEQDLKLRAQLETSKSSTVPTSQRIALHGVTSQVICQCNPCLASNLDSVNGSEFSLTSADFEFITKIKELVDREKEMKQKIETLNLKGLPSKEEGKRFVEKEEHISKELLEENMRLMDELKDLKLEMKQCIERVEGPIARQIEKEKCRNKLLENELLRATKNTASVQQTLVAETNDLKIRLQNACRDLCSLAATNESLKEEVCLQKFKCKGVEDALIFQKLTEAENLKTLRGQGTKDYGFQCPFAPRNQGKPLVSSCICQCARKSIHDAAGDKDDSLHAIGRRLSAAILATENCVCCKYGISQDLRDTCKGIKNLVDIVDRRRSQEPEVEKENSSEDKGCGGGSKKCVRQDTDGSFKDDGNENNGTESGAEMMDRDSDDHPEDHIKKATLDIDETKIDTANHVPEIVELPIGAVDAGAPNLQLEGVLVSVSKSNQLAPHMCKAMRPCEAICSKKDMSVVPTTLPEDIREVSTVTTAVPEYDGEVTIQTEVETYGEVNAEVDAAVMFVDGGNEQTLVTTTITKTGTLEVITEGPAGIIETIMTYTDSGNVEICTEIIEFKDDAAIIPHASSTPFSSIPLLGAGKETGSKESTASEGIKSVDAAESIYSADISDISSKITTGTFQPQHIDEEATETQAQRVADQKNMISERENFEIQQAVIATEGLEDDHKMLPEQKEYEKELLETYIKAEGEKDKDKDFTEHEELQEELIKMTELQKELDDFKERDGEEVGDATEIETALGKNTEAETAGPAYDVPGKEKPKEVTYQEGAINIENDTSFPKDLPADEAFVEQNLEAKIAEETVPKLEAGVIEFDSSASVANATEKVSVAMVEANPVLETELVIHAEIVEETVLAVQKSGPVEIHTFVIETELKAANGPLSAIAESKAIVATELAIQGEVALSSDAVFPIVEAEIALEHLETIPITETQSEWDKDAIQELFATDVYQEQPIGVQTFEASLPAEKKEETASKLGSVDPQSADAMPPESTNSLYNALAPDKMVFTDTGQTVSLSSGHRAEFETTSGRTVQSDELDADQVHIEQGDKFKMNSISTEQKCESQTSSTPQNRNIAETSAVETGDPTLDVFFEIVTNDEGSFDAVQFKTRTADGNRSVTHQAENEHADQFLQDMVGKEPSEKKTMESILIAVVDDEGQIVPIDTESEGVGRSEASKFTFDEDQVSKSSDHKSSIKETSETDLRRESKPRSRKQSKDSRDSRKRSIDMCPSSSSSNVITERCTSRKASLDKSSRKASDASKRSGQRDQVRPSSEPSQLSASIIEKQPTSASNVDHLQDSECDMSSSEIMAQRELEQKEIKMFSSTPDDCNYIFDCRCAVCSLRVMEKHKICGYEETSRAQDLNYKENCHPPDCSCVNCLCDPYWKQDQLCAQTQLFNTIDVFQKISSVRCHAKNCFCDECLCKFDTRKHPPECYCLDCLCKTCSTSAPPEDQNKYFPLIYEKEKYQLPPEFNTENSIYIEAEVVAVRYKEIEAGHREKVTIRYKMAEDEMDEENFEDCACVVCACPSANLIDSDKEHCVECDCPSCLCENCAGLNMKNPNAGEESIPVSNQPIKVDVITEKPVLKCLDDAALQQRIHDMEAEKNQSKKEMTEVKTVLKEIHCACNNTEGRGQAQKADVANTMSDLQVALDNLQDKCRAKDQMIDALTHELRARANSKIFTDLLKNLARHTFVNVDYDRTEICATLPRPLEDYTYGKPSHRIQKCEHPEYPNCPCAVSVSHASCENTTCTCDSQPIQVAPKQATKQQVKDPITPVGDSSVPNSVGTTKCLCPVGGIDVNTMPMEIVQLKQVAPDSLLVKWNPPSSDLVVGYEIDICGILKSRIHSVDRTSAIIHNLMFNATLNICLYAVSTNGRCVPPATAVFHPL